jgi:hypothetical protein
LTVPSYIYIESIASTIRLNSDMQGNCNKDGKGISLTDVHRAEQSSACRFKYDLQRNCDLDRRWSDRVNMYQYLVGEVMRKK